VPILQLDADCPDLYYARVKLYMIDALGEGVVQEERAAECSGSRQTPNAIARLAIAHVWADHFHESYSVNTVNGAVTTQNGAAL
jgi:hypothetical protein